MTTRHAPSQGALAALGHTSYDDYLRSPHWRSVRRRYFADPARPQVCICGAGKPLLLHHRTYKRLGAERLDDLYALCFGCHEMVHACIRLGFIPPDANPEILRSPERTEQVRAVLADARERARAEANAPRPFNPLDPVIRTMLLNRAKLQTRISARREAPLKSATRRARRRARRRSDRGPIEIAATLEDLETRTFEP